MTYQNHIFYVTCIVMYQNHIFYVCIVYQTVNHMTYQNHIFYVTCIVYQTVNHMTYQNHIFYVHVLYIRLSTIWHTRITSFMYVYCISDCQPYDIPESHLLCMCIVYQTVNHMTYQNHIFYVRVLYIRLSTSWHTRITSFMYMYCISDCQPYDIPESHLLCTCIGNVMCVVYQTVNHMTYQNHIFCMYVYCISDCQPYDIPESHLLCTCIVYQTVNHMTYQNHIFYVHVLYIRLSTIWHTRITSFMYVYCISDCQPYDIPESHLLCDVYCISDCQPYDIPESHLLCMYCISDCQPYDIPESHLFMYVYCISDCQPYDIPESHLLCTCIVYQTVNQLTYQNHIFYVHVLYIRLLTIWHTRITSFMYVYWKCDVYCISDCQSYDIPESHLLCTCIVYQTVNHMTYQNHIFYVHVLYIRLSTIWHTRITSFMYVYCICDVYCISDCQPYVIPESHLFMWRVLYIRLSTSWHTRITSFMWRVLYIRLSIIWHTRITSFMWRVLYIRLSTAWHTRITSFYVTCIVYQAVNHMTYQNHIFYVRVLYIRLSTSWHTRITSFMYMYCISDCQPYDIPESHLLCTCIVYVTCIVYQTVNHMSYQNHIFLCDVCCILDCQPVDIPESHLLCDVYSISDCQSYDIPESHLLCTCIVYQTVHHMTYQKHIFYVTCIIYQTVNHMTYQNHIFYVHVLYIRLSTIWHTRITSFMYVYCISDCQPYDIPESHLLCMCIVYQTVNHMTYQNHIFYVRVLYIRLSTSWHTRITSFM